MKIIWILFLLVFTSNGFSQDTLANVSIHTWAGGQCCSSGTDVSITLSNEVINLDFDSLVYISSRGQNVLLYSTDFHAVNTSGKSLCTLCYGWSSIRYGQYQYTTESISYYGLAGSRFRDTNWENSKLKIYRDNQLIKEGKVKEQFSMTAYP